MNWIIYIFFITLFFVSCDIADPEIKSGDPIINKFNSDTLYVGDTLKIYGDYFSTPSPDNFIRIKDIVLKSQSVIKWYHNEIWLIVPDTAQSGDVVINSNQKNSNSKYINIRNIPNFDIILIKAGKFTMGSPNGNTNERPTNEITITKDFYISKTEITQKLYRIIIGINNSSLIDDNLPVNNVTWLDAIKFCNRLSTLQNLDSCYRISGDNVLWDTNANGWRLPTEAEWEYACRANTKEDFYSPNINDICWYSDNSGYKMHPVATKLPNNFGIYDMSGNLWEWCYDFFSDDYYNNIPKIDPKGPNKGSRRIVRGGAFDQPLSYLRSSNRTFPANLNGNVGIRIVRNNSN